MILRVTPHKRPDIKDILAHPYFTVEDSTSTKESEIEHHKFNKTSFPEQKINMTKPQQKSYPFYAPTTTMTPNYNPEMPSKSGNLNTTMTSSKNSYGKTKPGSYPAQYQKQGMNTSFGAFSSMNYRNS